MYYYKYLSGRIDVYDMYKLCRRPYFFYDFVWYLTRLANVPEREVIAHLTLKVAVVGLLFGLISILLFLLHYYYLFYFRGFQIIDFSLCT